MVNTGSIKTFKTYSYAAENLKLTNESVCSGSVYSGLVCWFFFLCGVSLEGGKEGLCWAFFRAKYSRLLDLVVHSPD